MSINSVFNSVTTIIRYFTDLFQINSKELAWCPIYNNFD